MGLDKERQTRLEVIERTTGELHELPLVHFLPAKLRGVGGLGFAGGYGALGAFAIYYPRSVSRFMNGPVGRGVTNACDLTE